MPKLGLILLIPLHQLLQCGLVRSLNASLLASALRPECIAAACRELLSQWRMRFKSFVPSCDWHLHVIIAGF